jgi:hypothetical protein
MGWMKIEYVAIKLMISKNPNTHTQTTTPSTYRILSLPLKSPLVPFAVNP